MLRVWIACRVVCLRNLLHLSVKAHVSRDIQTGGMWDVRKRRSNLCGHTDGLVMFACSGDASDGQSS